MGGLMVATVLTLIFLPTLYVAWFRIKAPVVATDTTESAEAIAEPQPLAA